MFVGSMRYGYGGEVEEGEANNIYGHDGVSLSYIDEKIQDVLGDCRKDFEGGFTAENLGAKFGEYGSFLPTYQRSPAWPHSKTPPKVLTYSSPSPNNAHIEVARQNSITQTSASQPSRNGSWTAPRGGSTMNGKLKQEVISSCGDKSKSTSNFSNDSDQKSLKVRIRVCSDDTLTRKNAEIYSGLGLDVSPSSSLEASPVNSDRFFHAPRDGPDVSPTSILEMMTSFPVAGSFLLSPLPYDILHLSEKKLADGSCGPTHKGSQESTVTALHGSDSVKVDQNVLGESSKSKSTEKNSASMESTNGDDVRSGIDILPKKETSVDNFAPGYQTSSSGGQKKSEGGLKNESLTSKTKKKDQGSKSGKVKETYREFFGELDLEPEDHDEMAVEKPSEGINIRKTIENHSLPKERSNGKRSHKPPSPAGPHVPTMGNELGSDVAAAMAVPVVKEDWVCCDKCEKWRLLPPGMNIKSFPEKWLCSMLDWLPGMNRCIFSQEETTEAVNSRFPGPHPGGPQLGVIPPDGTHQYFGSQIPSSGVKKKHGNEAMQDKPSMSSNSSKKNPHTSYKTRSLNQSLLVDDMEFQDSGHSHDVIVEKDKLKKKENHKPRENFADEGDTIHHSKISKKRESGQDFPKDFKRVKTHGNDGTFHTGKSDNKEGIKKRKKNGRT